MELLVVELVDGGEDNSSVGVIDCSDEDGAYGDESNRYES